MFDFVAKHKRILQVVLFLTIIPFAFFGLESYTRSVGSAQDVATIDGAAITQREFADEVRRQQDRLRQVLGNSADLSMLDTPEMRTAILDSLISQRIMLVEAAKSGMAISKEDVIASILAAPEFQEGGKFSSERYMGYLRSRGMSDEGNVSRLRVEVPAGRLAGAVSASAFQPRVLSERLIAMQAEKREVSEALLPSEQFLDRVKLDDAMIKAYYEANAAEFKVPERVRAEYLVLSAEELGKGEAATEAELKAAYDKVSGQLGVAEQRRASHILVATKEEAEKIAAELRKAPQRFGELAKTHSQDTTSAANGGDLGSNARGALAAKSLEDAIFKLKNSDTSDPIQSDFGYHIVRVTGIQAAKTASFDELKKDLAAEIAKQKAAK